MAIDVRGALRAALETALEQRPQPSESKEHHLPAGGAVLIGAGLFTVGRLAVVSAKRSISGLQRDDDEGEEEFEPDEDFDEEEEDPEAEEDEDFDEEEEEPEAEEDEDFEDEEE